MSTFDEIKISKPIRTALEEAGFTKPTDIQKEAFSVIRSGNDTVGIAQTGTGKTLAYLIPILMKLNYAQNFDPRVLIVVPTRELVLQVCETVELLTTHMDLRCEGVYGGVNIKTQMARLFEGIDILVATPGRLMDIYMTRTLKFNLIKTLVIDEADKMMDLGFMPQLNAIFQILPEKHQNLLFSATFSDTVAKLSESFLINPRRIEVAPQATTVKNIHQLVYHVPNTLSKINLLKHLTADKEVFKRVMVFTETKKNADRISAQLEEEMAGELATIHSNKTQNTRIKALTNFKDGTCRILVASDVAARGLDIADVSHVINFDIPTNYTEYVHRIGRTGRAEKEGTAISFANPVEEDIITEIEDLIRQKIEVGEHPDGSAITHLLLEDEKKQTRNIRIKQPKRDERAAGAFHEKKAKNMKTSSGSKGLLKRKTWTKGRRKKKHRI